MFEEKTNEIDNLILKMQNEFELDKDFINKVKPLISKIIEGDFPDTVRSQLMDQLYTSIEFHVTWKAKEKQLKKEINHFKTAINRLLGTLKKTFATSQQLAKKLELQNQLFQDDPYAMTVH